LGECLNIILISVIHNIKNLQGIFPLKVLFIDKYVFFYLTQALPFFNNSLPVKSLRIMAASIYQAERAQKIRTTAATVFITGKPKWPKSNSIKPINNDVKVTAMAEWIYNDPIQKITVNSVQATK
jgi:hypothetical protein